MHYCLYEHYYRKCWQHIARFEVFKLWRCENAGKSSAYATLTQRHIMKTLLSGRTEMVVDLHTWEADVVEWSTSWSRPFTSRTDVQISSRQTAESALEVTLRRRWRRNSPPPPGNHIPVIQVAAYQYLIENIYTQTDKESPAVTPHIAAAVFFSLWLFFTAETSICLAFTYMNTWSNNVVNWL